jgi:SsrA-binding protein
MAARSRSGDAKARRMIAVHKRARHRYEVVDTVEAGLVLVGTEVKTLRAGKVSLDEAFGRIDGDQAFLVGAYIQEYAPGNRLNHEPTRKRKLLLRKRELRKLKAKVEQRGFTLVPLSLYWSDRNLAKLELGLCRGKRTVDKRETLKKREVVRELRREG